MTPEESTTALTRRLRRGGPGAALKRRLSSWSLGIVAALALSFSACGLKANPQPAALVRPETITDLSAAKAAEGVRLEWTRPDSYANGDDMPDLGGFKVFRGVLRALAREIADIKVSDRERFQRQRRFTFVDKDGTKGGSYYYRIVSYTTDQYYSAPSNQATIPAGP